MAFAITRIGQYTQGNQRVVQLRVVADADTSATVQTGLKAVLGFSTGFSNVTSAEAIKVLPNQTTATSALAGAIGVIGCTAADDFYLTVYGR